MREFIFRFREPVSAAGSVFLMALLLLLFRSLVPTIKHLATNTPPIELRISEPEVQLPAEQQVAPLPLKAIPAIRRNASPVLAPPKGATISNDAIAAPAEPAAHVDAATAMPAPSLSHAVPAALGSAVPLDAPSAASADAGRNAEAIYVGKVRAYLQSIKRYPTGREASLQRPTGTSMVWFMVRRSGELVEAGIESSSGSMLLDNAAVATVRRSIYPAFPDEVWPGKAQQRFTVELNFVPAH